MIVSFPQNYLSNTKSTFWPDLLKNINHWKLYSKTLLLNLLLKKSVFSLCEASLPIGSTKQFLKYFIGYVIIVVPLSPLCPLHSARTHFHNQSFHCCPCPCVLHICLLTHTFTFFQSVHASHIPSYSYLSVPWFYASGSILFISLFFFIRFLL